ncbi:MAG TPA: FliM/FliN family flagellar motor switch protein [Bacteroidota bacterium]|nr:FliM/FliN family flagellar motor switch protein [Bacteroidota bacterium]
MHDLTHNAPAAASRAGRKEAGARRKDAGRQVALFDFREARHFYEANLRLVESLHRKYADALAADLSARLRQNISVSLDSVGQQYFLQYVPTVSNDTCLYSFRFGEARGTGIFEMDSRLVIGLVSRMLGGIDEGEIKPRRITRLELTVTKGLVQDCLERLSGVWHAGPQAGFRSEGNIADINSVQSISPNEVILVVAFTVTLFGQSFFLKICYPATAVEERLEQLGGQLADEQEKVRETKNEGILNRLEQTTIAATCILGNSSITMQEFLDLEPGDVIRTNRPVSGEFQVFLDGKPRFWGRPGISNRRLAIKVTRTINDRKDSD